MLEGLASEKPVHYDFLLADIERAAEKFDKCSAIYSFPNWL